MSNIDAMNGIDKVGMHSLSSAELVRLTIHALRHKTPLGNAARQ